MQQRLISLASICPVALEELSQTLIVLNILEKQTSVLCKSIDNTLVKPLLEKTAGTSFHLVGNEQDTIELVRDPNPRANPTKAIFESIEYVQSFCNQRLPKAVLTHFGPEFDAAIVDHLMETTLKAMVPLDVSGLPAFQQTVDQVRSFASSLGGQSRQSRQRLIDWADDASNIWLSKHVEESLNSVRRVLKRGLGRPRQVERVETQVVKHNDEVFAGNGTAEDWNTDWSDEENEPTEQALSKQQPRSPRKNGITSKEDEDVTGWGFEDEDEKLTSPVEDKAISNPDMDVETNDGDAEQDEAWGWGDDDEATNKTQSPRPTQITRLQADDTKPKTPTRNTSSQGREVTLRESYHVSALPDQILEFVVMIVEDADALFRIG